MIELKFQLTINRPLDEVFEYVSDMENLPQWGGGVIGAKRVTNGPIGVGTVFRLTAKPPVGPVAYSDYEYTEYERNRKYTAVGEVGPIPFTETWVFDSIPTGVSIHIQMWLKPGGFLKLLQPFLGLMFGVWIRSDFSKLKRVLEAKHAAQPA